MWNQLLRNVHTLFFFFLLKEINRYKNKLKGTTLVESFFHHECVIVQ